MAVEEARDPLQFRLLSNKLIGECFLQGVECEYCCPFGCDVVQAGKLVDVSQKPGSWTFRPE